MGSDWFGSEGILNIIYFQPVPQDPHNSSGSCAVPPCSSFASLAKSCSQASLGKALRKDNFPDSPWSRATRQPQERLTPTGASLSRARAWAGSARWKPSLYNISAARRGSGPSLAHPNHGVTHRAHSSVHWELHGWCGHSLCPRRDPRELPVQSCEQV